MSAQNKPVHLKEVRDEVSEEHRAQIIEMFQEILEHAEAGDISQFGLVCIDADLNIRHIKYVKNRASLAFGYQCAIHGLIENAATED